MNQQAYDNLPLTPISKHVDVLCKSLAFGNLGHTPRPSATERAYISGFRDFNQGQYENARKNLTEAVALARKEAAKDPSANNVELLGLSLGALGFLLAVETPAETLTLYAEALSCWEKTHGKESPKLVFLLMDLSSLAKLSGKTQLSVDYCDRARQSIQASSGPKSLELQGILINLATLKSEIGQNAEATELFTTAIANLKESKHPSVKMAMEIFQQHLEKIGEADKAAEIKKEILSLKKK